MNAIHTEGSRAKTEPIDGPISFPSVNQNSVIVPCINGFDVHKVLVDPDSATDLLQLPAFRHMKLSSNMLNLADRILSSFNEATTVTLGDVALHVKAGPITQKILFSVVEDLGLYNVIVGWTWPHSMKAIPSTYHQVVNYLTSARQFDLLSS